MVFLRKTLYLFSALLMALPLSAKKVQPKKVAALSVEQEQQFAYYWYAARQAIEEERYADAYALLEFCHALQPDDAQTLYFLGVMYKGLNKPTEALDAFEQSYRLQPHNKALLEQLLRFYLASEEWKKALQIQDALDRYYGYDAYSAVTRYRIYAAQDQPKKAIAEIDHYLETDPDNLRFLLFRVELMEHMRVKQKELYALYERVLALDPANLLILNNYAWHLATHKGDLQKAERMSQITIREQPDNPVYLDTYGWIMHLQGQDELAKFYLQKALWNANDATNQEIKKHLDEIRPLR